MFIFWSRIIPLFFLAVAVGGCAEFNNRGGFVDWVEDKYLFPATTKTHRLLRSYALAGAFAAVARRSDMTEQERKLVAPLLKSAHTSAREVFSCLYPQVTTGFNLIRRDAIPKNPQLALTGAGSINEYAPVPCMFFDEKMARLNYDVYKLAAYVLADRTQKRGFEVTASMLSNAPLIGPLINATAQMLSAATDAAAIALITAKFVNDVFRLAYSIDNSAAYLFPIYRDLVELDMRIVTDSILLTNRCAGVVRRPTVDAGDACAAADGFVTERTDVQEWRNFLQSYDRNGYRVQAYPYHFAVVSKWIYRSCVAVATDRSDCTPLLAFDSSDNAVENLIGYRLRDGANPVLLNARRREQLPAAVAAAPARIPTPIGTTAVTGSIAPTAR